jgi:hypothetical protein
MIIVAYDDEMVMELTMADLAHKRDSLAAEIAQKRLELFDLQGA